MLDSAGLVLSWGTWRLISFFKERMCQHSTSNPSLVPLHISSITCVLLFLFLEGIVCIWVWDEYQSERMKLKSHLWLKEPGLSTPTSPQCLSLINTDSPHLLTLGIHTAKMKSLGYFWKYALPCTHEMIQFSCVIIFVSVWGCFVLLCIGYCYIVVFHWFLSTGTELKNIRLCYGIVLDSFVKHVMCLLLVVPQSSRMSYISKICMYIVGVDWTEKSELIQWRRLI